MSNSYFGIVFLFISGNIESRNVGLHVEATQ